MRAMLLEKPKPAEENPLRLADVPLPTPGAGQIRVRVSACAVCHTDLHIVESDIPLPRLPIIPGHQIVGVVDALGAGAQQFREGERVGIPWLYSTCGECAYCRKGLENLCEKAQFTGYHVNGGYAEAVLVPEAFAYPIPAIFSDLQAAPLLCAGIIGFRALRLSNVRPGERLGLFGFGASAHVVIQLARHEGCEVYAFSRTVSHRQLASQLGATWVGTAEDSPPEQLDAAIVFAPAGKLVLDALRHLRKGGTVALAGITMSTIPEIDYRLLYHERIVRSVANCTRADAHGLLHDAEQVPVRTEIEIYPLAEANQALQNMKQSKIGGAAVLKI